MDDLIETMRELRARHPDAVDKVYVWHVVPPGTVWQKNGRIAVNFADLKKLILDYCGEFGPADRLMGVPVLYADNDNAVRREVMEHFFLDFL